MPNNNNADKKGIRLWVKGSFDIPFFTIVMVVLTIGLIMLFSASYAYSYHYTGDSFKYIKKQLLFAVVGVIAMFIVSKIDYHLLRLAAFPLYGVTIVLLLVVLAVPEVVPGFKRWIEIGPITIQPSDIAKFSVILLLAHLISKNITKMKHFKYGVLMCCAVFGVVCVLVIAEKHVSALMLIALMSMVMMYVGGTNQKYFIIGVAVLAALLLLIVFVPSFMSHAGVRITAWLDKDFEPRGARWQTNQSLYAIGSGGFFGAGFGNSKQKFLYVSEPQNDFIFAIVCEELGFFGAALIVCAFIYLVWRGFQISIKAPDKFGALLVIGIVSQVAIQVLLNIAVVTDTIPNTGIAFPFFSYGGTALLMLLFEIGVVLSVSRQASLKKV